MALFTWTGLGLGDSASDGDNWDQLGTPPGAGDDVQWTGATGNACDWDILAKMGSVTGSFSNGDTVNQLVKLSCVSFSFDGSGGPGSVWNRLAQDIEFDDSYTSASSGVSYSGGETDICVGSSVGATYQPSGPFQDLLVRKISGKFIMLDDSNGQDIIISANLGSFIYEFQPLASPSYNSLVFEGVSPNITTVKTSSSGTPVTMTLAVTSIANQYADVQDVQISGAGAPIVCDGTCIDSGNNVGITFGAPPLVNPFICVTLGDLFTKLIDAVRADADLVTLIGDAEKLATHLPESLPDGSPDLSQMPYVFISLTNGDWSTKCKLGFETLFTFNIWSEKRDPSQAIAITDRIMFVLEQNELSLTVGKNVLMHFQDQNLFLDNDTKTYRSVLIMRALSS